LADNARIFSALDQYGNRVTGFPYCPLSSGEELAVYSIMECPHPGDPARACLDVNHDGAAEYTFVRTGPIPYHDVHGRPLSAPPILTESAFSEWVARLQDGAAWPVNAEMVLTAGQYRTLRRLCPDSSLPAASESYVWLNSTRHGRFYAFEAQCRKRGTIRGTSVIPPNKLKEMLPPKTMNEN
jgi:hypothetical protein